ncbi:putative short-chain dehydrogenase/reductase [Maudiozyma humilis]|uniref:Short-chain dehydrogenase/reductase n=1 Tax=Maudiozyma humilis TaxID=51915 RepID=A0AAV5S751_MAUHU|nr:putative short-chain dehydrogenase/reductase [Kazachstania humilis]
MARDNSLVWDHSIPQNLDFKTINALVVGGTGGLGRSITAELLKAGANVTVIGQTMRDEESDSLKFIKADLSSMKNAEEVAKALNDKQMTKTFTHVIFTNGIFASRARQETEEGIERDMAISYLSRYAMLNEIMDNITKHFSAGTKDMKPRVFIMAYPGTNQLGNPDDMNAEPSQYSFFQAHMNTVAANEAMVLKLAKDSKDFNIYGLNPGMVKTSIRSNLTGTGFFARLMENMMSCFQQTPEVYASKMLPLLVTPAIEDRDGTMFNNKGDAILPSEGLGQKVEDFWKASDSLLQKALSK